MIKVLAHSFYKPLILAKYSPILINDKSKSYHLPLLQFNTHIFQGSNHYNISFIVSEIIKLAKLENESQLNRMTQIEQDTFEMQVRAANIGALRPLYTKLFYDIIIVDEC